MATKTYLEITDGNLSAVLADGAGGATSYQFAYGGWAPTVASRRATVLGGLSPYSDVAEEIVINVTGATPDAVLANVATLWQLIERAERWAAGQLTWSSLPAAPVLLKYSPGGSTVSSAASPMQAVILGRAPGDTAPVMNLPGTFESKLLTTGKYVMGVRLRFLRRGEWLHTTETASSAAAANADLASATLTARDTSSPTKITITNVGLNSASAGLYQDAYVLVGDALSIGILNAESWAGATDYTSVNDAAHLARNTNVLRFTPTATTERLTTVSPVTIYGRVMAVFASIRINNTDAVSFKVRVGVGGVYTPPLTIVGSAPQIPHWYMVGIVVAPDNIASVTARRVSIGMTAAQLGTIVDIDSLAIVDLSNPNSHILALRQTANISGGTPDVAIDHQALSKPTPNVSVSTSDPAVAYSGNVYVTTKTNALRGLLLQCGGDVAGDTWRAMESAAVISNTWTFARTTAYLIPV